MKFLVDENVPSRTVGELRALSHDVADVRGTADEGSSDDFIWSLAQREQRVLITTDKGFVEHRFEQHAGLLVVRLRQPNEGKIHSRVMSAVRRFDEREWPGTTVVMRDTVESVMRAS
jgi:predicted nuclease of predicted toxin-antitoxin system